jgi:GNAT superfamily N-acetyltransferase
MTIVLSTPGIAGLGEVVRVLREWQHDGAPVQLHPGDLGWYWRFGAGATAAAIRTWSRDGQILAVGLLDGPALLRVAIAPAAEHDDQLARQMSADVTQAARGVLPPGAAAVEARFGMLFRELLFDAGWQVDEPWTPLRRDLAEPVEVRGLRVEAVNAELAGVRAAVQGAAFARSTFTVERWHAMAAGVPYADARCLIGYDEHDVAVAAVTVWSAGAGRPGLLEPMGVHSEHRGHGYGSAITVARQPRCASWARPAPSCVLRAPTPAPSRPIARPAFASSLRWLTCSGPASTARRHLVWRGGPPEVSEKTRRSRSDHRPGWPSR